MTKKIQKTFVWDIYMHIFTYICHRNQSRAVFQRPREFDGQAAGLTGAEIMVWPQTHPTWSMEKQWKTTNRIVWKMWGPKGIFFSLSNMPWNLSLSNIHQPCSTLWLSLRTAGVANLRTFREKSPWNSPSNLSLARPCGTEGGSFGGGWEASWRARHDPAFGGGPKGFQCKTLQRLET